MGAALATLVQLRSEYTLRPREPYHAQAPHPALCVVLDSAEHQNHAPLALTDSAPNDPLVPTPPSSSFTWPDRRGSSRCLRGKTGRRLKTPRSLKRASRAGRETKLHGTSSHDSAVSEDADWEEEEEVLGTMDCADAFSYFYPPEGAYKELESPSYRLPARTHLSMEELTALYTGTRRVLPVQPPQPAELSSTSAEVGCPLQKPATPEAPCGEVASKDVKDLTPETQNNPSKSTNTYLNNNICQGTGTTMTSRPFHTLVESLRDHCCHHADEPSLSWRAVDRIGTSNRVPTEQDGKTGGNARRVSPAVVHYMGPIQTISFAQLWEKVESFACGLRSLRLKPGDLLAVMEDTRWEWLVSCYAAWSVGLVVVAIPTVCERTVRQVAMDTAHQMKAVICSRSAASMARRAFRDALMPPKEEEMPSCELDGGAQVLGDVRYSAEPTTNTSGCTSTMSRTPAESSHEARLPTFIIMWSFPFYDSTDAKNARGHGAAGELSAGSPSEGVEDEALWWSDVVQHGHEQLEEMRSMSYKEWASLFRRRHRHHNPVSATQKPLESMSRVTTATTGTAGSSVLTSHARPHPSTWGTRPIAPAGAVSAESAHAANATLRAAEVATVPLAPLRPTDIALISYTCGESKGVMLTHAALSAAVVSFAEHLIDMDVNPVDASSSFWVSTWKPWLLPPDRAHHTSAFASPLRPETGGARPPRPFAPRRRQSASRPSYLAYLPLWNPGELVAQSSFLLQNYLLCFGSQRTLLDGPTKPHGDLTAFRPLVFAGVAWTLDRMCRSVQRTLTDGYRRMLFEVAYEARRQALRRGLDTPYLTKAVFAQPRQLLGGRCRLVLCVESTILPRTQEYLQVACGVEVSQVYGSAETAGVGLIQPRGSSQLENIGCPFGSVELKMRDVGEWSHGNTRPSGELLIRGPTVMAGFYRQPERTAMVLESGGWLHTGDIVELQMDGTFRMVGLLRNEMRTAEGWSVDVESLERTLGTFELCQPDGVLVLVHPYRPFICALILTDATRTRNFIESNSDELQALGYPPVRWPLCLREPAFNKVAAQSLNRWARQHGIAPHEQLRSVRVLFDDWDRRNGLRSATGRLRRRAVEQRYAAILEELFAETPEDELSAAL